MTDLPGSRHGTWINNERLAPGVPRKLKDRDRIGLAREEVVLTFAMVGLTVGETWDYLELLSGTQPKDVIVLVPERREVIVNDQVLMPSLSGKLYVLLEVLYDNRGAAVSDFTIKMKVWPERGLGADGRPLVTDEELATLVYRLRKRLDPHGDLIRTVPGYGYMLDLPQ